MSLRFSIEIEYCSWKQNKKHDHIKNLELAKLSPRMKMEIETKMSTLGNLVSDSKMMVALVVNKLKFRKYKLHICKVYSLHSTHYSLA